MLVRGAVGMSSRFQTVRNMVTYVHPPILPPINAPVISPVTTMSPPTTFDKLCWFSSIITTSYIVGDVLRKEVFHC